MPGPMEILPYSETPVNIHELKLYNISEDFLTFFSN